MRVAEQFSEHATSLPRPVQARSSCLTVWLPHCLQGMAGSGTMPPSSNAPV